MDTCEPIEKFSAYRRVIQTAIRRSEEKSILLRTASLAFRGRRMPPARAKELIEQEADPRVKGILMHRLFGDSPNAPFSADACRDLLERQVESPDPDLSRFSASLLLQAWPWFGKPAWRPPKSASRAVKLLMLGLGLRARAPKRLGVLDVFFRSKMGIGIRITWRKALGKDWREAERRCLKLQKLEVGDPSARIMLLDTFNELLIQNYSVKHPNLVQPYKKAAGRTNIRISAHG